MRLMFDCSDPIKPGLFAASPALGLRVIEDANVPLETYMHEIPEVRFAHGADHRAWKRLVRERRKHARPKTRSNALIIGGAVILHPDDAKTLREAARHDESVSAPSFPRASISQQRTGYETGLTWPPAPMPGNGIFRTDGVALHPD